MWHSHGVHHKNALRRGTPGAKAGRRVQIFLGLFSNMIAARLVLIVRHLVPAFR
jgi:hypothetical protein